MAIALRQSTASQEVLLGPFLDETDGITAMTGLTIANTDIKIWVNGATSEASKNSGGATHIAAGRYYAVLDATDTATVGPFEINVHASGALPVRRECHVYEEAVYDAFYGASALGYVANAPVNVAQISSDSTAADNLELAYDDTAGGVPWQGIVDQGTAQSVGANDIVLRSAAAFVDDGLIGCTVVITNGTQVGSRSLITDYVGATDTATLGNGWTGATPSGTPTYKIFASAAASGVAQTGDAYAALQGFIVASGTIGSTGNSTTALHLTGLTYGDDEINDYMIAICDVSTGEYHARWIEDWADTGDLATVATLPFTPQNATDTYKILAIRQDVTGGSGLDAAGVRAAVGLASANLDTQLGAIDDFLDTEMAATLAAVDTEVAAIKAKTDNLPSDPADASDIAGSFTTVNSKIDAVDDLVDTEVAAIKTVVDAIKAKTDSLTFTTSNQVDANVQSINDVAVNGAGTSGSPWGP